VARMETSCGREANAGSGPALHGSIRQGAAGTCRGVRLKGSVRPRPPGRDA
jgi:hypothetical protein